MKPMVKALIACGLLAALVGVFFLSQSWQGEEDAAEPTPDNRIQLLADTPIEKVVLQNANGEITLLKEENDWTIAEHSYARLLSSSISSVASSLKGLMSTETVTTAAGASLAEFGLAPPQSVVTVTHEDGMREVLLVGMKNPSASSYYAMREGGDEIVLMSSYTADRLLYGYESFRDTALTAIDPAAVEEVYIQNEQEEIWLTLKDENSTEESFSFSSLTMLAPYAGRDVASDKLQTLVIEHLASLVIGGFVEDNAADLSAYGLDEPAFTLRIQDTENTLHLLFGADAPEGGIYFMIADEPHVYTMQKDLIQPLMSVKGFDVADRFIIIFNISTVDSIQIQDQDRSWELSIQRTPQEGEEEPLETYFLNGVQKEEKPFKNLYETTISIMGDAALENDFVPGKAEVTITFIFNDGKDPVVMRLYVYDENFYLAERDGQLKVLTSRRYMDTLRQTLQALAEA